MKTEPRFRLACQQRNASYSLPCSGGFLTRLGGLGETEVSIKQGCHRRVWHIWEMKEEHNTPY